MFSVIYHKDWTLNDNNKKPPFKSNSALYCRRIRSGCFWYFHPHSLPHPLPPFDDDDDLLAPTAPPQWFATSCGFIERIKQRHNTNVYFNKEWRTFNVNICAFCYICMKKRIVAPFRNARIKTMWMLGLHGFERMYHICAYVYVCSYTCLLLTKRRYENCIIGLALGVPIIINTRTASGLARRSTSGGCSDNARCCCERIMGENQAWN